MDPLELDADVPPSARHVAHVLQEEGPCSLSDVRRYTSLPKRTATEAIARLEEEGIATSVPRLHDSRGNVYRLAVSDSEEDPASG